MKLVYPKIKYTQNYICICKQVSELNANFITKLKAIFIETTSTENNNLP